MKKAVRLFVILWALCSSQSSISQTFPEADWEYNSYVRFSGWDTDRLDALRAYVVDSTASTGMLIVHDGKIIFEYGNVTENSYIASCRKSILAMLYGKHVTEGTLSLEATLQELEVTGLELLLKNEKKATVQDIIASRSGIFLPASNPGDMQHLAPKRGSVEPGTFWLYNNWDFNMAGHIFEKVTQKDIYDEIETQLALPLGMQDWDRTLQQKDGDRTVSDIMAYHMWFSARDMARMGLLMLHNGKWNDKQVLPEGWVSAMTTPKTTDAEINAIAPFKEGGPRYSYGYMWWLWAKPDNPMLKDAYSAQGAWGQNITVFPEMNTVLVIKTNDVFERQYGDHYHIVNEITKSYNSQKAEELSDLAKSLHENDIEKFLANFESYKKVYPDADYETILNQLGYDFLERKAYAAAVAIFKFNVEQYPEAWNLYDSLGEGLYLAGDYTNALTAYQKARKLNVDNQYGYHKRHDHIMKRLQLKTKTTAKSD